MLNLLKKVFPDRLATPAWQAKIREIVPSYGTALNEDRDLLAHEWSATAETLHPAAAEPGQRYGASRLFGSRPRACAVAGLICPVDCSPRPCWKRSMADCVPAPQIPSTSPW